MSYNKPPCLLRDWTQRRLTTKSPYLLAIEERQARAKISPNTSVTRIRKREARTQ